MTMHKLDLHMLVFPGEVVSSSSSLKCGSGCYSRDGKIIASVIGSVGVDNESGMISVVQSKSRTVVPAVGSTIIGRVLKINPRLATVSILIVEGNVLEEHFQGIVRVQDVRATEIDKVEIYKCFRPGDIIRAVVISLGTSRSYYLTTTGNELGVLLARCSTSGEMMVPVSWQEMQCPKTHAIEYRKVAKNT